MSERYIAFDVETPNDANNRMSAIGVSVRPYIRTYDLLRLHTVSGYRR